MKKLVIILAAALLMVWSGLAGTVTVVNLPATGTDLATGINATNTYVCCIDFGNNASPPGSINGVPFIHPDLGNQIVNTTNGADANHGGSYTITTGGSAPCMIARTTSTTPSGQADGNTWKMLNDTIYVGSAAPTNSWLNQTYGGLVAGRQYRRPRYNDLGRRLAWRLYQSGCAARPQCHQNTILRSNRA